MTHSVEKPNIILLYESELIYQRFLKVFADRYIIHWGKDLNTAVKILSQEAISVLVCDVDFQNQEIYPVILALKHSHPELVAVIVSQNSERQAVEALGEKEEIFAALVRPVSRQDLVTTLERAVQSHVSAKINEDNRDTLSNMLFGLTEAEKEEILIDKEVNEAFERLSASTYRSDLTTFTLREDPKIDDKNTAAVVENTVKTAVETAPPVAAASSLSDFQLETQAAEKKLKETIAAVQSKLKDIQGIAQKKSDEFVLPEETPVEEKPVIEHENKTEERPDPLASVGLEFFEDFEDD